LFDLSYVLRYRGGNIFGYGKNKCFWSERGLSYGKYKNMKCLGEGAIETSMNRTNKKEKCVI
jgi:hypothetical protein